MATNLKERIGFGGESEEPGIQETNHFEDYLNLKFAARGMPIVGNEQDYPFLEMGRSLILNFQERLRLLKSHRCPADEHITNWLNSYLDGTDVFEENEAKLPDALYLEKHGLSRLLSLPARSDKFESDIVSSFRTWQGVCHNPAKDRRTTKGVFHVTEGGLPIAADKLSVPKVTFAHMLKAALNPPEDLMVLPYTSEEPEPVRAFASIMLRPVVSPEVPGVSPKKTMETRFFAPGNLVSNLDFVESIFGNAGDPFLPENDARLDVEHWTGHTGCVILAPHLITLKKKDVGLPHISEATEHQKAQKMCWESEDELYNDGGAFKLTARDLDGVVVTLIADNYFGYCKKEVKTQLSYATNLYGNVEEEHAGGALVFPSFDLGEVFNLSTFRRQVDHTFDDVLKLHGDSMHRQPEGHGIDKNYDNIVYVPEGVHIDLHDQSISWENRSGAQKIQLKPDTTYVMPSGYKVEMRKPSQGQRWRLIGTNAEGTFCHKPCTVSGGGKSEISKSLSDAMQEGPVIMPDFENDMFLVDELLKRDYGDRYREYKPTGKASRAILDPDRSLGSVIRLFSQSKEFSDAYNEFIATIPRTVRDFILTLKRYWKPDWGTEWRTRFHVDSVNGQPGFLLKYRRATVMTGHLRIGFASDGSWRMFGLRKDFAPSTKLQREDDISVSVTIPASQLDEKMLHPDVRLPSYKFLQNCEFRLFQRPDDAIHPGYDKQTERDFSRGGNFFSNYEPKNREEGKAIVGDAIRFNQFTDPLKDTLESFASAEEGPEYCITSAHPRMVEGKPSENPRYLQNRPDLENPRGEYLAEVGSRLFRRLKAGHPVLNPVHAVLPGRRNNPPNHEAGIRPLAVYGPIHYQELPELFMDYIASLTGKSPSTTGAGSEGALTKGPFNALQPVIDLNGALLSYIVSGYEGFSTAAGYIGPNYRVDHDISLIVPEVWSRMFLNEREPAYLKDNEYLEKINDFEHNGETILGSRLGYRVTNNFVTRFFGRVFTEPASVFTADMLQPELQNMDDYVDGIKNITETQKKVALAYFEDGSIDIAIPPLKALLHIMAHGEWEGKQVTHGEVRDLFDREKVMASDWYKARLEARTQLRIRALKNHIECLEAFLEKEHYAAEADRLGLEARLKATRKKYKQITKDPASHSESMHGCIGLQEGLFTDENHENT